MRKSLILACLHCFAPPALAETLLERPASCERIATAQYSDCNVSNHFKCPDSSPVIYRVESVDQDGLLTVETYDENQGAVGLVDSSGDMWASFVAQTEHPRVALTTGLRDERFEGALNVLGAPMSLKAKGAYRYSGETLSIAGETFHRMPFEADLITEGTIFGTAITFVMLAEGSMIFNERLDLWIVDIARTKIDDEPEEISSLRLLSLAGQDGFGIEVPTFGCGAISLLPPVSSEVPA